MLALGNEIVELLQFDRPGCPYPAGSSASDLSFQHFAIVATGMAPAWQRLRTVAGWSAITRDAPQRLPKSSGGVVAFKFRDPEGHPLELLAFASADTPQKWRKTGGTDPCLGIDHSAISVADSAASSAFYDALGLAVSARTFNQGLEQEALDDVAEAQVEVTALSPTDPTPHVELLCYRVARHKPPVIARSNDIAATRLVLELCGPADMGRNCAPYSILDPDAHHLTIDHSAMNEREFP